MDQTFDFNAFAGNVSRIHYTDMDVEALVLTSAAAGMMPKDPSGDGPSYNGSVRYRSTTSSSPVASTAFSSGNAEAYAQFAFTYAKYFTRAQIAYDVIQASRNAPKSGALAKLVVESEKSAHETMGVRLGEAIWGDGGGSIGQLNGSGSVTGTAALSLTNPSDLAKWQSGMIINSSATNGNSGTVRAGSVQVANVDIINNLITPVGNWNAGIAAITNADFLFEQGGFGLGCAGIPAIIPDSNNRPTAGNPFFGVDRAALDPARLAGLNYNGGGSPDQVSTLISALSLAQTFNNKNGPQTGFLHYNDYTNVVKSLGSRSFMTQDVMGKAQGNTNVTIGYSGIKVTGPGGSVELYPDTFVPSGTSIAGHNAGSWLLNLESWVLASYAEVPQAIDYNGIEWNRIMTDQFYAKDYFHAVAIYCAAPFKQMAVNF